jgi:hypothetical protein
VSSSPPQLDYSPAPPRPARWLRLILLALLACGLLVVTLRWSLTAYDLYWVHRLYSRCAGFSHPPTMPVYTELAAEHDTLYQRGDYGSLASPNGMIAHFVPPAWRQFNSAAAGSRINTWATLFLHELNTPDGKRRRLVGVDLTGWSRGDRIDLYTCVRVFSPAPLLRTPTLIFTSTPMLSLSPQEGVVRILAGQLDPADPSHFTISYTVNDKPGVYDGWLKDDDRVVLEPRPTPTTAP